MRTLHAWIVGLLLFPALAFADDITQIATTQPKTVGELLISLLPHVLGLISFALATYVAPALKAWLSEKAKMNALARVALKVETLAESIVAYLNASMKAKFEAAAADGKITAEEGKELADEALRLTKEFLGKEGLLSIGGVLGLATGMVDVFLKGQLEKAVEKANVIAAQKAPELAPSPR